MTEVMTERRLSPAAQHALDSGSDAERLRVIRRKPFIRHETIQEIFERLEEAIDDYPTEGDSHILIYGESGIGKSKAAKLFAQQHSRPDDPDAQVAHVPVMYVSMAGVTSGRGLLMVIMSKLGAPHNPSISAEALYPTVVRLLARVGVKVLIIDEIHHVAYSNRLERLKALSVIKGLGNDLNLTIVGCGTPDALRALKWDPQLERRFEPIRMPRWRASDATYGFLNSLETTLPLRKPSFLSDDPVAAWIIEESEGLTREITFIVRKAAIQAIRSGREQIDLPILKGLRYVRASKRRQEIERVLEFEGSAWSAG